MLRGALHLVERTTIVCVLLLMQSACAPQAWVLEADRAMFIGDFEHALTRYEDLLLSQSRPTAVSQKSALCVEELHERLTRRLIQHLEGRDYAEACLAAYQLEQLAPHFGEHERFTEVLSARGVSRDHDGALLRGASRLAHLHLCPLESQWSSAYRVKEQLTQSLLKRGAQAMNPQAWSQVYVHINQLVDVEHSNLGQSFSPFLEGLRDNLRDQWSSFWRDQAYKHMSDGAWSASWIDYSLAADHLGLGLLKASRVPHTTSSSVYHLTSASADPILTLIIAQLNLLGGGLMSYGVGLDWTQVPKRLHPFLQRQDQTPLPVDSIKETLAAYRERWSLSETGEECHVKKRRASREVRYLDHHQEVVSPRYKAALKRVESQQETLEAAQSQREDLERSLKSARSRLQAFKTQLTKRDQELEQLRDIMARLSSRREHLQGHIRELSSHDYLGPPTPTELELIAEIKSAIASLKPKEDRTKISEEIAVGAKTDHLNKLKAQRAEVDRLSGYLARTTQEIVEAQLMLEERERDLKSTSQFDQNEVYSVFRYPVVEHHLTCEVRWDTRSIAQSSSEIQGPPSSWHVKFTNTVVSLSHRAFTRYGVKSAEFNFKPTKAKLLKQIRETLALRVSRWLDGRRVQWVSRLRDRWSRVSSRDTLLDRAQDELLTVLTFLDAQAFSHLLSNRISARHQLGPTFQLHPLRTLSDDAQMHWMTDGW